MKRIELTQGKVALVDDEDFDRINEFNWHYRTDKGHTGYARRSTNPGVIWLHRFILNLTDEDEVFVDHINGVGTDCQKHNLRIVNTQKNNSHLTNLNRNNTSGYRGVTWHERHQYWQAQIHFEGKKIHIGTFDDPKEAAKAYDRHAKKLFGKHCGQLNFDKTIKKPSTDSRKINPIEKIRIDNTSSFKGVDYHKSNQLWRARIWENGKSILLGYFNSPQEANEAVINKEKVEKMSNKNRSGYRGVSWHKASNRWMAQCKGKYLGSYSTPEEASKVYEEYKKGAPEQRPLGLSQWLKEISNNTIN